MAHVRGLRDRRFQRLIDAAVAHGWKLDYNGSGHPALYPAGGGKPIWLSATLDSKEPHAYLNVRASLRRRGVRCD